MKQCENNSIIYKKNSTFVDQCIIFYVAVKTIFSSMPFCFFSLAIIFFIDKEQEEKISTNPEKLPSYQALYRTDKNAGAVFVLALLNLASLKAVIKKALPQ